MLQLSEPSPLRRSPHWPFFTFALGLVPVAGLLAWAWLALDRECTAWAVLIAIGLATAGSAVIVGVGTARGYDRLWTAFTVVAALVVTVPWAGLLVAVYLQLLGAAYQ